MKEQPLFAPGDRVVCVNSKTTSIDSSCRKLIEGNEYTIKSIERCSCGTIFVKVGLSTEFGLHKCMKCGSISETYGTSRHRQTRFVPVDFDKYAEETFHQSLKGKPVNA